MALFNLAQFKPILSC